MYFRVTFEGKEKGARNSPILRVYDHHEIRYQISIKSNPSRNSLTKNHSNIFMYLPTSFALPLEKKTTKIFEKIPVVGNRNPDVRSQRSYNLPRVNNSANISATLET
uniref:Uncharacterized protein n=1 Tax=Cacopsylla melanoneura TaxID=428564 RepID=A0A8D8QA20_9HEMI